MILNKADFKKLHDELEEADSQREHIIKEARDVLKGSKTMIYSVQRNELNHAGKLKEELKKDLKKVVEKCRKFPDLYYSGSIKVAEQEFVEALCFYEFVKNKSLPTVSDLGVTSENYLLGLCDLSGELTRKAINASIKENYNETLAIWEFLETLYGELMRFDFRNSELRRKFDGIKYDLQKIENVVLELKLKNKV